MSYDPKQEQQASEEDKAELSDKEMEQVAGGLANHSDPTEGGDIIRQEP